MTLILTWFFLCLAMFILLWGLGFSVQQYLYESIADNFALRATIAGILVGCFYTFWVYVNTRAEHKDRYGVLQDFSPTATSEISEFIAIREYPNFKLADGKVKTEQIVYKRTGSTAQNKIALFLDDQKQKFKVNDSQFITSSVIIKDAKGEVVFDAIMDAPNILSKPNGRSARYLEKNGKRFIESDQMNLLFAPNTAVLIGAITLNVFNYLIWVVALWLCLRFTLTHAVGGAVVLGAIMMLIFVPLLFTQNEIKKPMMQPAAIVENQAGNAVPAKTE